MMDELEKRIAGLSRAKRAILDLQLSEDGPSQSKQKIPLRQNRDSAPLSFAQQRLWFLDQFEPNSPFYNLSKAVKLSGALNLNAVRRALETIIDRHETLRTSYISVNATPVQVITKDRVMNIPVTDLTKFPEDQREQELESEMQEELQRPFNLSRDLMLRATLFRLSQEEHLLLLVMHHIASDAWSLNLLLNELGRLYTSYATGLDTNLPPLPIQYGDFAQWQKDWLKEDNLNNHLQYWKEQLKNIPPLLQLPTDRTRPVIQTYRGARLTYLMPAEMYESLVALGKQNGATLFMTLLATFKILLHRYTGQEEIVVGSPIAGRIRSETENLIGFFVNTLVLRSRLPADLTFQDLLAQMRETALQAFAHQDVPFEKLVEELRPERSLSHSPLFQVMFVLQNIPTQVPEFAGLTFTPMDVETHISKFDLTLYMGKRGDEFRGRLEYNTDLFDQETMERMLGHFNMLLKAIVARPDQRISELALLTPAEQELMLVHWNNTKSAIGTQQTLHGLFEAQVEKSAEAVAVVFEKQTITYRELNRRANQLAHHLISIGVGPEVHVAIYLERSIEMMIAILAVLKAGGAYIPLDPTHPAERLAYILEDSLAALVITQDLLTTSLSFRGIPVLKIDADWNLIEKSPDDNPDSVLFPRNAAYLIYTSGSTGRPKGVIISHFSVVNLLQSMAQHPGLTEQDVFLAVTTLSFDISILELFLPLIIGAQVVVASREDGTFGDQLISKLSDYSVTAMQATPATWQLLLDAGWQPLPSFKIFCGGEALPRELAGKLLAGSSLWNLYGPTETTIWSMIHQVHPGDPSILIGKPIANTQVYVLDKEMQPVPIGVPGELHIGGFGIARGYWNRPELIAEKFLPDPFGNEPGGRLYQTGDTARFRSDGNIEFLGRQDYQVKVRGFRIELGEIEAALEQYPAIDQNVVIVREDMPGDKRLVAYIVANQQSTPSVSELRSFLSQKLPEYMVPSAFVFLDALPRTPNGKVDRANLLPPEKIRPELDEEFIAPRNAVEQIVADIWCELLRIERVGVMDNFFDLGGHSLLATQIISRVRDLFQIELPLRRIFEAPTIDGLAEALLNESKDPAKVRKRAEILSNLSRLTDDEVESLLGKKMNEADV